MKKYYDPILATARKKALKSAYFPQSLKRKYKIEITENGNLRLSKKKRKKKKEVQQKKEAEIKK